MEPPVQTLFESRANAWPRERIARLDREEIEQLRANALALGETAVAELCDSVLATCTKARRSPSLAERKGRRLLSRSAAFEARGVYLDNARTSWSGVRSSDKTVVIAIWADDVQSRAGSCDCLLWSPGKDGADAWFDTAPGLERLKHCELAAAQAVTEVLLVHGERLEGHAPQHKARSVHGIDPQTVVRMRVEKRGREYWAVWGKHGSGAADVDRSSSPL